MNQELDSDAEWGDSIRPAAVPKFTLALRRAAAPIRDLVTKFGGQPVWNGSPTWPLSRSTGQPMEFLAQVRLDAELFATAESTMAYVFVTDAVEALTYDPYGGENAVVLQPGEPPGVDTVALAEGPSLHHLVADSGAPVAVPPERCEFTVVATPGSDPEPIDPERQRRWAADPWLEYQERAQGALGTLRGTKVGGQPHFYRGWPDPFSPDRWRLLLQLEEPLPFFLNLGFGTGYVLVRSDLAQGVFFWERPG